MKTNQVALPILNPINHVMVYVLQDMVVRIRPQKMDSLKTTHVPWYLERFNNGKPICRSAPLLNFDCIMNILEFLDNDPATLFACALVNRGWCKIAIRILWRDPWRYKSSQLPRNKKIQMISIFLESLPQHYLNLLIERNVGIPIVPRKTLFDYAKFVRYIRIRSLEWHLTKWVQHNVGYYANEDSPDLRRRVKITSQVLLEHIFRSTPTIYGLIVHGKNYTSESLSSVIRNVPEARISLISVKTFTFGKIWSSKMPRIFETLSTICNNINTLEICPSQDVEYTARLISNQMNIISVTFEDTPKKSNNHKPKNKVYTWDNRIFRETLHKAKTITQLTLKNIYLSLGELNDFENLEELYLINYTSDVSQDLSEISLKSLKKFSIISLFSEIYLRNLCKFIKNSKELTHLKIQGCNLQDPDYSIIWINSLARNNKNLISYEGPIGTNDVVALWILLDSCTNLQKLHLRSTKYNFSTLAQNTTDLRSFDYILRELTRKQPAALRKLIVGKGWTLSSKGVENFIKSRKNLSVPIRFEWDPHTEIVGDINELAKRYCRAAKVHKS